MRSWILHQQISHQLGRVRNERDNLVVRHARRADDTNYSCQRASVIRSGHYCEIRKLGIIVLVADRYRDATRVATTTQELAELLARLSQLDKFTHVVNAGEFGLLSQHRRLPEQYAILV